MNIQRKKVVGLVRVSTDQQAGDDRAGLPRQRNEIAKIAEQYDLDVIEIIEFAGVSGTLTREMPETHRMLRMVRQRQISGIVVADLDRLVRTKYFGDYAIFDDFVKANAVIWTSSGPCDPATESGTMQCTLRGMMGGLELRSIMRRVQGAREQKRKRGELGGFKGLLPKGIDYDFKTRQWSTTPDIFTVTEAFRIVDEEGVTNLMEISRRLGVNRATLKLWLRNKLYMGIRRIDKKRGEDCPNPRRGTVFIPGKRRDKKKIDRAPEEVIENQVLHNPPVSCERWQRVQEILAATRNRRRQDFASRRQVNLGRGLLVCGHCQSTIYANSGINRKYPNRQGYYFCRRNHYLAKRTGSCCPQPNVRKGDVDALLSAFVAKHLTKPETLNSLVQSFHPADEPTVDSKPLLDALNNREERLIDLYERGEIIGREKLRVRMEAISVEREKIQNAAHEIERRKAEAAQGEDMLRRVVQGAFAFARLACVEERKTLLDGLLSQVTLTGTAITAFKPQPEIDLSAGDCANRSRVDRGSSRRRA